MLISMHFTLFILLFIRTGMSAWSMTYKKRGAWQSHILVQIFQNWIFL